MKSDRKYPIIACILLAAGILSICLPALLQLALEVYKYFICSGFLLAAMASILPAALGRIQS